MKIRSIREEYHNGDCFTLYPIGDIHLGSACCDKHALARTIKDIRDDPNARWLGMGDYAEYIGKDDPRWSSNGVDTDIVTTRIIDKIGDVYVDALVGLFTPIIDKCWGLGRGNHEEEFQRRHHTEICERILKACGRPDLYNGWAALTLLLFRRGANRVGWRIYSAHGWQGGRMEGNKVNESRRLMSYVDADVYLHGHSHSRWIIPQTRLDVSAKGNKLVARRVWIGHTGSFLRTLQEGTVGYAERKGYPPTDLGPLRILFKPNGEGNSRIETVQ
jgi:hypothetical protein